MELLIQHHHLFAVLFLQGNGLLLDLLLQLHEKLLFQLLCLAIY